MIIYWAHIDTEGTIISWGQCSSIDFPLQEVPEGLTVIDRPEYVTGYDGWRFINNQWVQILEET